MNGTGKVLAGLGMIALTWVILMSAFSLLADGWVYEIVQPVPVMNQNENSVTLMFDRYSICTMEGHCSVQLVCDYVYVYEPFACPVEMGHVKFFREYPIPDYAGSGTCHIVGLVGYAPLGVFGPRMVYEWRSEEFEVIR